MSGTGERAYVYAKACGIIGKSFIGKRMSRLNPVTRLSELDRLVFSGGSRELPERELLVDLERRIIGRAAKQITIIVNSFADPPELLVRLLRSYEYADVKSLISALTAAEPKPPEWTDIGRFRTVRFEAYPDLQGMFGSTEFAWLLDENLLNREKTVDVSLLQTRLDQQYYTGLWESLDSVAKKDRLAIEKILAEEIALRNAAWALRLRTYYGMNETGVRQRLVLTRPRRGLTSAGTDALASLSMALDSRRDWQTWKRAAMLNPERSGEVWRADPRYFQNAASAYLYRLAYFSFRRRPLSIDTTCCFIKLKQFEEDLLTSVAEGLAMGMPAKDVFTLLEVQT